MLKPVHAHWIKSRVYKTLEDAGYTDVEQWLTLVLTGSLTTYQFSNDSDVDISLFVDSKIFPEWSRAEMIAVMVDKLDGKVLPGTPHLLQDFVVGEGIKPGDLYKPGLRSGYNIDNNKWIVPPERDRAHDVKSEEAGFYAWSLQCADKMERLLRYEPDAAIQYWHQIHAKRQRDMRAGKGDFAESNILYKMLSQRGLFPEISQASGEYIAKTEKPPHLRESKGEKACWNCWAYDNGHCEMFGGYKVREDQVCDDWEKDKSQKTAVRGREVAKFVYDPVANHMLMGKMGREEGEQFSHNQLRERGEWEDPSQLVYGQVGSNGYGETFGRSFPIGPLKAPDVNPYQRTYQAQEALRRAVPGAKFTNPSKMLRPEWAIDDPKVTYIGEPPKITPAQEEDKRWDFQAKIDVTQVAQRIYEKAIEGVGSTINLHGESPHTRFGFAPDLATQTPFPVESFSPADVEAFVQRFSDRLQDPEKFVGSWIQDDQVILDVTEGHDDFDTAYQRAWNGHQRAIWDSQINDEIPVRGLNYVQPIAEG